MVHAKGHRTNCHSTQPPLPTLLDRSLKVSPLVSNDLAMVKVRLVHLIQLLVDGALFDQRKRDAMMNICAVVKLVK